MPRQIEITVTYLEMLAPPQRALASAPRAVLLHHAVRPAVSFYRYLYNTVGKEWLWYERRQMSDEQLRAIIHDPRIAIHVLYVAGVPAGYGELDLRHMPDLELAYFGLMPEFIGKGLGKFFLAAMIDKAWAHKPQRVWLHTCTLDHPHALAVYQRAGFAPYQQEKKIIDDPRDLGVI
jgi:GNAT superfamily N-acetyltransferase